MGGLFFLGQAWPPARAVAPSCGWRWPSRSCVAVAGGRMPRPLHRALAFGVLVPDVRPRADGPVGRPLRPLRRRAGRGEARGREPRARARRPTVRTAGRAGALTCHVRSRACKGARRWLTRRRSTWSSAPRRAHAGTCSPTSSDYPTWASDLKSAEVVDRDDEGRRARSRSGPPRWAAAPATRCATTTAEAPQVLAWRLVRATSCASSTAPTARPVDGDPDRTERHLPPRGRAASSRCPASSSAGPRPASLTTALRHAPVPPRD